MNDNNNVDSIFSGMSANDTIKVARGQRNPVQLWKEYWIENEVCCLFADSNVGKSILAVQIGDAIAKRINPCEAVLYYDFELSKKQFEIRYTDEETNIPYGFSDNFIRVELNTDAVNDYCERTRKSFDDVLIDGIEANIRKYNSRIIIIDNLSWLVNMKDSASTAGKLMKNLCSLKANYGLSILVLSHTTKRNLGTAITQNSLNGSKKLANFFDAMFSIGMSIVSPSVRYVKQIKVRTGEFKYGPDNVELYSVVKDGSMLRYNYVGRSTENEQLKPSRKQTAKPQGETPRPAQKKPSQAKRGKYGRSSLASAQIDFIKQMADDVVSVFGK